MDTEIIQTVLTEVLEEQKASLQATKELSASVAQLANKVDGVHQNVNGPNSSLEMARNKLLQSTLTEGIRQIQHTLEEQPKSTIRQIRILLFPEQFADQYYRIVFGRLLFWMMIFLISTYLFALGKQGIQSWEMVQLKNGEANHAKAAFNYLYWHADKEGKKKMIDAWEKSRQTNQ